MSKGPEWEKLWEEFNGTRAKRGLLVETHSRHTQENAQVNPSEDPAENIENIEKLIDTGTNLVDVSTRHIKSQDDVEVLLSELMSIFDSMFEVVSKLKEQCNERG